VSLRDTLVQLGLVLVAIGAVVTTWALYTGPLARYTDKLFKRDAGDDPRT
jgi:hypothetical protein